MTNGLAGVARVAGTPLLASDEPPVVDLRDGTDSPFVFLCEHASNRLPHALGDLGLPAEALERHIAWDPGAAPMALGLAEKLGGPAILQTYSRLVIDCNREPGLPDAITTLSEDTKIPGNEHLGDAARRQRVDAIWAPFHAAIDELVEARIAAGRPTVIVTLHSFTPVYRGVSRPWHVGIISSGDRRFAEAMLAALRRDPALVVGDDEPYSARDNVDYTIRRHGFERGLPHVMIEVRNDLIRTPGDVVGWVDRLAGALVESADAVGMPARQRN
ncbi:MAG: N-formylglutamate amidohydrolase [Candidatus Kaistia colombiensis]|nr:MAG: N-formylglutamate amidohydrolase [Kaistia sp.]